MKSILVLNCGSSSIKFSLISITLDKLLLSGIAENLFSQSAILTIKKKGKKKTITITNADHHTALGHIIEAINSSLTENNFITAIGHRVVHGGEKFKQSCLINKAVITGIEDCNELAPLHNPANVAGIKATQCAFPNLPQVAVFDTAFHQTIPEKAFLYALPYRYYQDYAVRRYGFHGTSYRYICESLPHHLPDFNNSKVIIAHLGNGGSVVAINNGEAVDTSMGFTPLAGLVQGTRSGDIDPTLVEFLSTKTQQSAAEITDVLWKESGLLGISECSNDCRTLEQNAQQGDMSCQRALDIYIYRLVQTIAGYTGVLSGLDCLVFTGGIGENSSYIRQQTCANLGYLGLVIDPDKNEKTVKGITGAIHRGLKPILVIPTNEELMIAKETIRLLSP